MIAGRHRLGHAGIIATRAAAGQTPWLIAAMVFLAMLAAAAALALGSAARDVQGAGRVTVQIVAADPVSRDAQARAVAALLARTPGIGDVRTTDAAAARRLLAPWLGEPGADAGLPIPILVDAAIDPAAAPPLARLRTVLRAAAPSARLETAAHWLGPAAALIDALRLLAVMLALLAAAATAATVALATRAALEGQRPAIEVLHVLGATDIQIAGLFQGRMAVAAALGGLVGTLVAAAVILLVAARVGALGLNAGMPAGPPPLAWASLVLLPVGTVLLAAAVARGTVLRALGRLP